MKRFYEIFSWFIALSLLLSPLSALAVVEISDGTIKALYSLEDTTDDSTLGHTLVNVGAAFAAGKLSNAAITTSSQSDVLYATSTADLTVTTASSSWAGWVYQESQPAELMVPFGKLFSDDSAGHMVYWDNGSNRLIYIVRKADNSGWVTVTASNFGALSVDTWYFVHAYHDANADVIGISVNNGVANTTAFADGIRDNNSRLGIGAQQSAATTWFRFWDGMVDELLLMKDRTLTSTELTNLYNGGSGDEVCVTVGCSTPPAPAVAPAMKIVWWF